MSVDLRLRHDRLLREQAVELFERASALETVEIGATITREATAADATRVRVRREGRTLIPCCERLIDRTSLRVSAC